MITFKLGQTKLALDIIQNMMNTRLPVSTAYNIERLGKKLYDQYKIFDSLRIKICEEFCDKDENGKPIKLKAEDREAYTFNNLKDNPDAFNEKMNELLNQEAELDIRPIPIYALDGAMLTPYEIGVLEPFLREPPEVKEVQK
jgi:hypothetical protein